MADDQQPLFSISRIARMLNIHPQTLRLYEREGFIKPARTKGNTRRYSTQDIEQIRSILHLTRDLGVNLAGVEIILNMQHKLAALQRDIDDLRDDLRRHLAERMPQDDSIQPQRRALIKASSRMMIKVQ